MALIWGVLPLESRDQHRIDTLAGMTEKKLLQERPLHAPCWTVRIEAKLMQALSKHL